MLSYKFVAASVGAVVAVTVAVVLTYPFAQTNNVNFSKAAKLDVSRGQPDAQCPDRVALWMRVASSLFERPHWLVFPKSL